MSDAGNFGRDKRPRLSANVGQRSLPGGASEQGGSRRAVRGRPRPDRPYRGGGRAPAGSSVGISGLACPRTPGGIRSRGARQSGAAVVGRFADDRGRIVPTGWRHPNPKTFSAKMPVARVAWHCRGSRARAGRRIFSSDRSDRGLGPAGNRWRRRDWRGRCVRPDGCRVG